MEELLPAELHMEWNHPPGLTPSEDDPTVKEAAREAGCTLGAVHQRIYRGQLPVYPDTSRGLRKRYRIYRGPWEPVRDEIMTNKLFPPWSG